MYSFAYLWCIVFELQSIRSKVSLFAVFSSTGVKFWKMIWFSWEASQIVRLAIHIEKQKSFHYVGCHHIWEITHVGGNICCFHRFPWSSMDMYPFHYITMSRRSKKYVKLFLIWILVLHQTVWHQFCKSLTIFQNLTPVELNIAKNETFDLFYYNSRTRRLRYVKHCIFWIIMSLRNTLVTILDRLDQIRNLTPMWPYGGA